MTQTSDAQGRRYELLAVIFLILKGYWPCYLRFRTPVGEVDCIVAKRRLVVFVEVKKRKDHDGAKAAISRPSQDRIRRAAALYLQKHPEYHGYDIRFDAVVFGNGVWPQHIENAF
jgi:putative endonuclease